LAEGEDLAACAQLRTGPGNDPAHWAALMRAPQQWFAFRDSATDLLVELGEIAEIRRGITSGANDFFYVTGQSAIEDRFLQPILRLGKSSSERIGVAASELPTRVIAADPSTPVDDFPGLRAHIARGEREGVHLRPTMAARRPWWSFASRPARTFLTKAYYQRYLQRFADRPVVADQRVYCLWPRSGVDEELLAAVLNASSTALAIESLGRASMGEGALELSVADARRLPVLDPRRLSRAALRHFAALSSREIGTAFEEQEAVDRARFEAALCPELDFAEQREALARQVAARVARAGL
jgi:hypothetical protein